MINHAQFYQKTFLACKHFFIYICIILLIYAPWSLGRKDGILNLSVLVLYQVCVYASVDALLAVRSPQSAILFYTGLLILTDRRRQKPITGSVQIPPYFCHGNSDIIFVERQPRSKGLLSYRNRSNDVAGKTGFQCCLCYGRFHVICIRNLLSLIYEGKRV